MSEETRPNLNCAGLTSDIITSLNTYIRGPAKKAGRSKALMLLHDEVIAFVEKVDEQLNQYFGTGNVIDTHSQTVQEYLDQKEKT